MIDTLTISGLGPHRATALQLDPKGRTTLVGPSAVGKTTLIDAVSWCLWGVSAGGKPIPDALIHDGAEHLEVTVKLGIGSGSSYTRRRKRGSKGGTLKKNDAVITTAADWAEALGPLSKRQDLLRAILAPMSWVPLLQGEGGGRPFRDLLAQVLPVDGLRSIVAEDQALAAAGGLRDGDSVSEAECYARRKDANARASELTGRLAAAEERVRTTAGARVEQPEPEQARAAKATLDAAEAWARYHQGDAARAWDAQVAALGERPPEDDRIAKLRAARDEARAAAEAARTAWETAKASPPTIEAPELVDARQRLRDAVAALERRRAAGTTCPECGQPVPNSAEALAQAESAEHDAHDEHDRILDACEKEHAAAVEAHKAEVRKLKSAADVAAKVAANLDADYDRAVSAPSARAKWDAATAALGKRPSGLVTEAPAAPEPSAQEVAHARDLQARLQEASGQRRQQERDRKAAVDEEARVRQEHERATAEAKRLDALVEAVRRAPSVLAARQVSALGDLGPVQILFPAEGPAVEVSIDGRPWWTASSGRRVIGDLYLRAALRRAAKVAWFPIFVDNVQDFSGEIPNVGGPTVLLRTAPGDELRVLA